VRPTRERGGELASQSRVDDSNNDARQPIVVTVGSTRECCGEFASQSRDYHAIGAILEMIDGTATSPSIVHQVFHADGTFAGAETLIRADLFAGQRCPTDQWLPVPPWLPTPTYYACHHFAFTP
jgi:hypothetical protein